MLPFEEADANAERPHPTVSWKSIEGFVDSGLATHEIFRSKADSL